ncbi:hypothetical protein ACWJKU_09455 [Methylocaldum sp. MU1018]
MVLAAFAIIGFGPLSLTCLTGMFIVIARPRWFYEVVENLYRDLLRAPMDCPAQRQGYRPGSMAVRVKCFLSLIVLLVLDIAPIPVAGSIGLYVVIRRPRWFKTLVEKIYCGIKE